MNSLGFVTFLLIGGMAFWVLFFLLGFVLPYWISLGVFEWLRPKKVFDEEDKNQYLNLYLERPIIDWSFFCSIKMQLLT